MPDNDPQTATTLYSGWKYAESIENVTETKRFYDAIVRRCSELPIGKAAIREQKMPDTSKELLQSIPNE